MNLDGKTIVGLTEKVIVKGVEEEKEVIARIDSGATKSSIDLSLTSSMRLGPVVGSKLVKSAHGSKLRPMIEVNLTIREKEITAQFTIADRSHMKYPVLIGQNILKEGFLIDPSMKINGK